MPRTDNGTNSAVDDQEQVTAKVTSMAGTVPSGELNGWSALAPQLVQTAKMPRYAVIEYDCHHLQTARDDGVDLAVPRVRWVEPVDGDDETMVRNLMIERLAARGGQLSLDQADPPAAIEGGAA